MSSLTKQIDAKFPPLCFLKVEQASLETRKAMPLDFETWVGTPKVYGRPRRGAIYAWGEWWQPLLQRLQFPRLPIPTHETHNRSSINESTTGISSYTLDFTFKTFGTKHFLWYLWSVSTKKWTNLFHIGSYYYVKPEILCRVALTGPLRLPREFHVSTIPMSKKFAPIVISTRFW